MIVALGIYATSPALHEQLHHGTDIRLDDGCAVALFANGVSAPLPLIARPPVAAEWREPPGGAAREIFLDSPRYLFQPERGPPAG